MVLICATWRERKADQSAAIATWRNASQPAWPSAAQPVSRLNSQRQVLDVALGSTLHSVASAVACAPGRWVACSTSARVFTTASAKVTVPWTVRVTRTLPGAAGAVPEELGPPSQ